MSFKWYLIIALAVGLTVFLLGYFDSNGDITEWAVEQQIQANRRDMPAIAEIVFKPVEFIFDQDNRPFGAIIAGVAWPATAAWIVLVIIGVLVIAGVDATSGIDANTPDF
jgi:hypothetical protein